MPFYGMDVSNRKAMTTPSKYLAKMRKPYTITKLREKWTDEEHNKFLEGIEMHGRAWQRIQEHVGTKTAAQIRSHAQKFFLKLQKGLGGMRPGHLHGIEIPPPRPKIKQSYTSDEVKMNTSASPSTDTVVMDAKRKKPVAYTSEQSTNRTSRKCHSCGSYSGNNSAYTSAEHLTMIEESVKKARKFLYLFEMNGKSTNPQMDFAPEEIYDLLKKVDKPFTKHTIQGEERDQIIFWPHFKGAKCSGSDISQSFTDQQDANTDLNLSLSRTRSKEPAISSIHQALPSSSLCDECHYDEIENVSPALSGFLLDTNSFPKLHPEASIASSLLAPPSADLFSTLRETNINVGEARDKNGNISSGLTAIVAATIEAATAWWKLNGLLPSPIQSNMSSATQTMVKNPTKASKDLDGDSGTKRNTKLQSCSTLLEPVAGITVEKIRVGKTGKPPNHSSTVARINKVNQIQHESPSCDPNTPPFSEAVNVRRFRNAGRFKQGSLAFEALFSQKVLPQSFEPLHLDDDDEVHFSMGKEEEAYGLQKIDLNRKIFTQNVCNSAEEDEGASSSILMPEKCKDWTE